MENVRGQLDHALLRLAGRQNPTLQDRRRQAACRCGRTTKSQQRLLWITSGSQIQPSPKTDGEKEDSPVGQSLDQFVRLGLMHLTTNGKNRVRAKANFASAINLIWAVQIAAQKYLSF
jgi:hypothetical protein